MTRQNRPVGDRRRMANDDRLPQGLRAGGGDRPRREDLLGEELADRARIVRRATRGTLVLREDNAPRPAGQRPAIETGAKMAAAMIVPVTAGPAGMAVIVERFRRGYREQVTRQKSPNDKAAARPGHHSP